VSLYFTFYDSIILEKNGHKELAGRYHEYWKMLSRNAIPVFYEPDLGKFRGIAGIKDTQNADAEPKNYYSFVPTYNLDDPWEGELFFVFASLFCDWSVPENVAMLWANKRLDKVHYNTQKDGSITVRKGYWYSAHEMWNFLVLPYRDDTLIRQLFHLGEVARTYFSAESKIPGLLASCNPPKTPRKETGEYLGGNGIPSLAEVKVENNNVVTPYAAFPVMIDDLKTGLAWYYTMIKGPRMLGPYGSTEAITSDGSNIAPVLTWDAKILPILALVEPDLNRGMRDALKKYGKYNDFLKLVGNKYRSVFGDPSLLQGNHLKLQLPTASIPSSVPDFESSKKPTSINLLADPTFIGTGMLYKSLAFNENPSANEARMTLPHEMGSVLMKTRHLQASEYPYVNFSPTFSFSPL
jgi:hypothetical protein